MRELVFEIPLGDSDRGGFPMSLLQHAHVLHLLRLGSSGYTLVCRVSEQDTVSFREAALKARRGKVQVSRLSQEKSGSELFHVSGRFEVDQRDRNNLRAMRFFKSIEKAPVYGLGNPTIEGKTLKVSIIADEENIKRLLTGMSEVNVPYKIVKLDKLRENATTSLSALTWQQQRVVKLAHTLGYYDIPRRASTEDIAKILKMDKGTVGEHLRRAEKHVFDKILS